MKLWIDDVRPAPEDYFWVYTAGAAVSFLAYYWNSIDSVSFDHDLGAEYGGEHETGYDVLKWIEQRVADGTPFHATLYIHSANPVGRKNMEAAIRSINALNNKLSGG